MATKRKKPQTPSISPIGGQIRTPKRDRLAITLTPESRAALKRLQDTGGMSASSFVSSMIHESVPVIHALAESFERAKKSPVEALEVMREAAHTALFHGAQATLELESAQRVSKLRRRRTPA